MLALFLYSCHSGKATFRKEIEAHRLAYKADFLKESRSPFYHKEKELDYLRFYPADPVYQLRATFTASPEAKPFDMATYSGSTKPFVKYGTLQFQLKGQSLELAVYRNMRLAKIPAYQDYLFLPFKDRTNGEATYGGGRYIDLKRSDIKEGYFLLDFNKCYNPWCAFSDGYNCPIPPLENHLDVAIEAGEKKFGREPSK